MSLRRTARARRLGAAALLLAPVLLIAWCFWPGHMSNDTLTQVQMAASGRYGNQHAPLLSALWRPFFELGMGPGWVLLGQLVTFAAGSYLVLRAAMSPAWAAGVAALVMLSPVTFGHLGYLNRDVWFTAFTLLAFGCAVGSARDPGHRRRWIGLALVACWLALASRQNAASAVVLVLGALAALSIAPGVARRRAWIVAAAVGGTVLMMGSQTLANAALGTVDQHPEGVTMVHDLLSVSHKQGRNLLPASVVPDRSMAFVDTWYFEDSARTAVYGPSAPLPLQGFPETIGALRDAWRSAIADHPGSYLSGRWAVMRRQLALGQRAHYVYHPIIDANPHGYRIEHAAANRAAKDYVEAFTDDTLNGGVLYTLWAYLLVVTAAGVLLVRRFQAPALRVVAAMAASALTLQAGLFVTAPSVQARFEYPLLTTTLLVVAVTIAALRRGAPATAGA